jgi:hypothetical protein
MKFLKRLRKLTGAQLDAMQDVKKPLPEKKKENNTTANSLIELAENAEYIIYKINTEK